MGEVRVVVDEARRDEASAGVDHAGSLGLMSVGFGVGPDDKQPLAADRKRLGIRAGRVTGPDARVAEDEVCVLRAGRRER